MRLAFDRWTGLVTNGATGTMIQPLSLAVTADVRHFELPQFSAMPKAQVPKTGWAVAVDALLPLLRATDQHRGNALTALVEYAYGYGDADFYAALNGGVVNPPLPNPAGLTPAPTYSPDVDPGLVVFDAAGNAHLINWQSAMVGLQYYFPRLDGKFWISADYSHTDSNNAPLHGPPAGVRRGEDWADVNLFGDVTPAVRLGLEYALFDDHYADGIDAVDHRVQLSAFYLF